MVKQKCLSRKYYIHHTKQQGQKKDTYTCKFCGKLYALNATRMLGHLKLCLKCPEPIKKSLTSKKKVGLIDAVQEEINLNMEEIEVEEEGLGLDLHMITSSDDNQSEDDATTSTSTPTRPMPRPPSAATSTSSKSHSRTSNYSNCGFMSQYVDKVDAKLEQEIWKVLARAVYASGTPLNFTENKYWIAAFKLIRPALKLPSRHQLSNLLLQNEYDKVEEEVQLKVAEASTLGIQCDGWSNLRNESIVNVIITTPTPVVIKSIDTNAERHTGQFMADIMSEVMEANGVNRFLGVVTDNASNMKSSWDILQQKYPDAPTAFYGCAAHILNLLIGDIMKNDTFFKLQKVCQKIVKEIKVSHRLHALFKEMQKEKLVVGLPTLKLPVKTRWASIVDCLTSLVKNKIALKGIAISEDSELLDPIVKSNILDDNIFWIRVNRVLELLAPLKKWITVLESDQPGRISLVPKAFMEIEQHFKDKLPSAPGTVAEEKNILKSVRARKQLAMHAVHNAANILHPKLMGNDLSVEEDIAGVAQIHKIALSMDSVNDAEVLADLANYRSKEGLWGNDFVWKSIKTDLVTPTCWWKGICGRSSLSKVAVAIMSLPATSAATERSFSTYGIVHTAKRNRLTTKRAGMLVYIKHNLKIQDTKSTSQSLELYSRAHSSSESDTEAELDLESEIDNDDVVEVALTDEDFVEENVIQNEN